MTHPAQRDAFETPHPQRQRAARFDVARPAGVSTAVVSYVLNGSPKKISPDTAQRVFDAAQRLDYHPNSVARALKTGTTHTLGVIVPDFSNPYFAEFTDQLEAAASKRERALIINLSRGDPQGERRRINELVERNVDAMFVSSAQTDAELGALSGQSQRHHPHGPSRSGAQHEMRIHRFPRGRGSFGAAPDRARPHEHGHDLRRRPQFPDWRVQGWNQAFRQAGLPTGPIRRSRFTREGGHEATAALLESDNPPDAIFAASDLEALGALRAIHERGLRTPEDIAVITFDGTVESLYAWPQLTAIKQNTAELAHCEVNAALDPAHTPDVQLIAAELVTRQSCGCK